MPSVCTQWAKRNYRALWSFVFGCEHPARKVFPCNAPISCRARIERAMPKDISKKRRGILYSPSEVCFHGAENAMKRSARRYCIARVASSRVRAALPLGLIGLREDPHSAIPPRLWQGEGGGGSVLKPRTLFERSESRRQKTLPPPSAPLRACQLAVLVPNVYPKYLCVLHRALLPPQ